LPTWTRDALSASTHPLFGRCWRVVEGQHVVSTMKLVDTLAEQALLEELIERSKPPVPSECRHLHYLLSTPFRYGSLYPVGSRFRRAGQTSGVFYASLTPATALCEMAFHRLLFFAESPGTPWPVNAAEHTAFSVRFRVATGLDLTQAPFDEHAPRWMHPADYSSTQELADAARAADVLALRYWSTRDPDRGCNVALFTCAAFRSREPLEQQTWRLHLGPAGVRAIGNTQKQRLGFDRTAFSADPRIAKMRWNR
jgi:hypothetical protein